MALQLRPLPRSRADGVGALRVFNDDRIVAGAEWPLHPHQDIESLTYVVEGHFLHADSLGNNGHLEPGAAQVMTFSHRGDLHSEKNGSPDDGMRFIQLWILPSVRGARDTPATAAGPAGGPHRPLARSVRATARRSAALTLLPLPDQLLDRARQSRLEVDQLPQFGVTTIRTMLSW
jgi:quercetin 2,3-dioxygenase